MIVFVYHLISHLTFAIFALTFNVIPEKSKLKRLLKGRKNTLQELEILPQKTTKRIWAHAASLGEFQMLLPLLQRIQSEMQVEIHVTFFSPSGYEYAENPGNWHFHYLLHDTPYHAKKFISTLKPDLAIFAKYEFWLSHLRQLNQSKIPFIFWNTLIRENHFLTKFWSYPWKSALRSALIIGCQNTNTERLLKEHISGIRTQVTGDVRFLQTSALLQIPSIFSENQETLLKSKPTIIWGSCWEQELVVFDAILPLNQSTYQFILAPHDVGESNLKSIENRYPDQVQRLSEWLAQPQKNAIILVDGIGKLKFLYRYADVAVVGGGFKNALHNIIEPLSNGIPVIFGAYHAKFPEALDAVNEKAALHAETPQKLAEALRFLLFHRGSKQLINYHKRQAQLYFQNNMPNIEVVWEICRKALTN